MMDIKNDDPLRVALPEEEEIPAGLSGATATIFLSITLILITYFVFLNAVGKPAHHLADQVAASVRESFRGEVVPPSETSREVNLQQKFSILRSEIEKFASPLRLSGVNTPSGDRVEIQFNPEDIFLDDGEIRASALEPLSGILAAVAQAGLALDLDIGYRSAPSGSEEIARSFTAAAGRASALIRLFVDRNGSISKVSGGGRIISEQLLTAKITVTSPEDDKPVLHQHGW